MKKLLLLTAIFAFGITAANAQDAKPNKEKKVTAKVIEKTRGANTNIKTPKPTGDKVEAEPKTRGNGAGTCQVYFNNHTGYVVDVYVDGNYKGTLSAYGSGNVYVGDGYTKIYCLSAGGTREWTDAGDCSYYAAENLY